MNVFGDDLTIISWETDVFNRSENLFKLMCSGDQRYFGTWQEFGSYWVLLRGIIW